MNMATKKDIFEEHLEAWLKAKGNRKERRKITDHLCFVTGMHRNSVPRKFRQLRDRDPLRTDQRGAAVYYTPDVTAALKDGRWLMRRREFIAGLGSAAASAGLPLAARAQQPVLPVVGLVSARSRDASADVVAAFRKGLGETGYVEDQNVTVEYHWLEGQWDRLPALMADLVRRRVAVITTPAEAGALAAKAATTTIPIVFRVGEDPVKLGLVASLARRSGNATGVNFFEGELVAKRLSLLHELVPKAVRVAVLVDPANATSAETTLRVQEVARTLGLQIHVLNATTIGEIDAAFATCARPL
jgi:putative tryptophan/tyrosine transport system substrate-binding protein